ncbi:MAG: xylose isomerase, partial [Marmoricola sp.]|nr:xylose isomerase [Marmoricola sp.]
RGDILLPTVGHAMAFISTLDRPELVGVNPEIGHEEMAGLNAAAGYAQALWQGKLFHIDLNGQSGPKYDQDLRFGAGNVRGAFWVVDTLLAGGYDGPVHFDFKTPRTEDDNGVWVAAEACMTNYLILREKALAFRADPEVQGALADAQLPDLARPTLAEGESWSDIEAAEVPDIETIGAQGMAFERLDQLALEHLYGVRS